MTELPDNILHLPQYQVLGCKSTDDEMHFQVDVPDPIACEECGVNSLRDDCVINGIFTSSILKIFSCLNLSKRSLTVISLWPDRFDALKDRFLEATSSFILFIRLLIKALLCWLFTLYSFSVLENII